ncbi:MAG: single-stranded-DNA-specific exonuclease RecJ [Myxococcota bacterium]|nr:single-stranded-DNA-specific exonuclease RecJ [Myxococcota bacterium]
MAESSVSFLNRPWAVASNDVDFIHTFAEELSVPPVVAHLLATRGHSTKTSALPFLEASLREMPDPAQMKDIRTAAARLMRAVRRGEHITIYGDYDVDGVTSAAVLCLFFRDVFNVELDVYIPHRLKEGYGLNQAALAALSARGTRVLVTVDNGSSAIDEVAFAQGLGMDVIIIDHHQVSEPEPMAFAHLNPHRNACQFPYKGLAAVGVAFLLLVEIRRQLRDDPDYVGPVPRPDRYLDLVALGTVADLAPLTHLNRALVRYGLGVMKRGPRLGVRALLDSTNTELETLDSSDLGYRLGPRINAAGRLDDAERGFRLLTGQDGVMAKQLATLIETQNQERRAIQERMTHDALEMAEQLLADGEPSTFVLASASWHPGVVGIVASKIVETFHRPAILLAEDGGVLKGSARSTTDVNIKAALDLCSTHLMKYGGHVGAAGLTMMPQCLDAFRSALNAAVDAVREGERRTPPIAIDAVLDAASISETLVHEIARLGPFGQSNPAPKFVSYGVRGRTRILKDKHLKVFIENGSVAVEALGWHMAQCQSWWSGPVDIVYTAAREVWRGRSKVVLKLIDMRPVEAS